MSTYRNGIRYEGDVEPPLDPPAEAALTTCANCGAEGCDRAGRCMVCGQPTAYESLTPSQIRSICMYCNVHISGDPAAQYTSHSCCESCYAREAARIKGGGA